MLTVKHSLLASVAEVTERVWSDRRKSRGMKGERKEK
jgi:hypothetical protein